MKIRAAVSLFFLTLSILPATAADSGVIYDARGVDVVANSAAELTSYIRESKSLDKYCKGPGSDYATFGGAGFSIGGSANNEKGGIGLTDTHGVQSLGGRTSALLVTRELMYRACELSLNTGADEANTVEIYKMFIDAIKDITAMHLDTGTDASTSAAPEETAPTISTGN